MPTIICSTTNPASLNIARALTENFSLNGVAELVQTKNSVLEVPCDFQTDYLIVPSTHKSESKMRSLTVHAPGNWANADLGGEARTLNTVYASKMKEILLSMKRQVSDLSLDWNVCLEVDHHGPTCPLPIMFVEIGSGEQEWEDKQAGEICAEAIVEGIKSEKKYKCIFGVGGGHYAPLFSKLELDPDASAFGHMLPKYKVDEVDYETFLQGIEKTVEKTESVLIDWKGLDAKQREKIISFCERAGIPWEKKK